MNLFFLIGVIFSSKTSIKLNVLHKEIEEKTWEYVHKKQNIFFNEESSKSNKYFWIYLAASLAIVAGTIIKVFNEFRNHKNTEWENRTKNEKQHEFESDIDLKLIKIRAQLNDIKIILQNRKESKPQDIKHSPNKKKN